MTLFNFHKVKEHVDRFVKVTEKPTPENVKANIPQSLRQFTRASFEVGQGHIEITIGRKIYRTPHRKGFMEAAAEQSYTHHLFRKTVIAGQRSDYGIIGKRIGEILDKELSNLTRLQGLLQIPGKEEYVRLTDVKRIIFKKDKLKVRIITGYEDIVNPETQK